MRLDQPRSAKYRCESAAIERCGKQNALAEMPEMYPQASLKHRAMNQAKTCRTTRHGLQTRGPLDCPAS